MMNANDCDKPLNSSWMIDDEDVISFQATDEEAVNDKPSLIKYSDLVKGLNLTGAISNIWNLITENLRGNGIETYWRYPVIHDGIKGFRHQNWNSGIKCEVLQIGSSGWQKGRLRIRIETIIDFVPDEESITSRSPLDEIRQMLDDN
jgi:hypothetical protein